MGKRRDQNTLPKLTPFLVPKSVTPFSVFFRNAVWNLGQFLVTEIGTSGRAHLQLRGNVYLAKAYRLESLGDCYDKCGMVWMRFKRINNFRCNNVYQAALCRQARSQESSVLASRAWLDVLPAGAESSAEYARFGNISIRIYSCGR